MLENRLIFTKCFTEIEIFFLIVMRKKRHRVQNVVNKFHTLESLTKSKILTKKRCTVRWKKYVHSRVIVLSPRISIYC